MRRGVEVGGEGKAQADEGEEGGDRVDNQNGREGLSSAGREVEVIPGV
jgi:hypothetical protein